MRKILISICCLLAIVCIYLASHIFINYNKQETDTQISDQFPVSNTKEKVDLTVLKIAHYFPESHPQHIALVQKFIPIIEEGSNWKIRIEVYPNSQLGGEKEYIQGVRNGTIEMAIGGESLVELLPGFKVIEFPYLFNNYDQAKRILNGEIGNKATEGIESLGLSCLAWSLNGFRQIATYGELTEELKHQQAYKIATTFSKENIEALKIMGFSAVPAHTDEMGIILKQKAVDGHDSPPLLSYYNGWYEKQKKIFITNHIISPAMYLVNSKFWNSLSAENKELIKKASKEAAEYETVLLEEVEKEIFTTLQNKGVIIEYPDLSSYKENVKNLYAGWTSDSKMDNLLNEILEEKTTIDRQSQMQ